MIPAFLGLDGRSLSSRSSTLAALALAHAGKDVSLARVRGPGEPLGIDVSTIHARVRLVEIDVLVGEFSLVVDGWLTRELLAGRSPVLDLPGWALSQRALTSRPDVVRVAPVGPTLLDRHLAEGAVARLGLGGAGETASLRFLSCGSATGTPASEGGKLGNAGRSTDRVGGRWLDTGLPDLPPAQWDAVLRGKPHLATLALANAFLGELHGERSPAPEAPVRAEPLAARLWSLAMAVQADESGFEPCQEELLRAPVIRDWHPVARALPALAGIVEDHPDIASGTRTVTSEVFFTDGLTYARTMSRLYRLGARAPSPRRSHAGASNVH